MHLLREGQFGVASTFMAEANTKSPSHTPNNFDASATSFTALPVPSHSNGDVEMEDAKPPSPSCINDVANGTSPSDTTKPSRPPATATTLQAKFTEMYHILHALRNTHDLEPAILWARHHSDALELRGSNLEFELCKLRFVELYTGCKPNDTTPDGAFSVDSDFDGPLKALLYARDTFTHFSKRWMRETASLMGSLAFAPHLVSSPYKNVFYDTDAWTDVSRSFVREFCGMLGLSEQSPLYTAVTAGGIALPVLEKVQRVMGEVGGQWTSHNELPVRPSYSPAIFVSH